MNKKSLNIFIVISSIVFGAIGIVLGYIGNHYDFKGGWSFLIMSVSIILILFLYRFLDYENASFRKLVFTGSLIAFFGLFITLIGNTSYNKLISEEKKQEIIDRKVNQRIKANSGKKLDIFKIEKDVLEGQDSKFVLNFVLMLLITGIMIFLTIIFSLIFRTDKKSGNLNLNDPISIE